MDLPAERARANDEGSLDPRYDAIYQRGYLSGSGVPQWPTARSSARSPDRSSARPADRAADRLPRTASGGEPAALPSSGASQREPDTNRDDGGSEDRGDLPSDPPDETSPTPHQRWAVLLAVAGLVLIVVGGWAYMLAWPLQFQGWPVVNDQARTPDGPSMTQMQLSQLALAVAPQLIILGVTAILADLAILAYGAATRARR